MTNITEFLGRDLLCVLPLICGMGTGGADYELFCAFCASAEQASDSADVRYVRDILLSHFGCDLPPDRTHCAEIWRRTADALLMRETEMRPPKPPALPCPALPFFEGRVTDCPPLRGAEAWSAWEANAKKALAGAEAVRVRLPAGFCAKKMSLWQAEGILRGEAVDPDGEATQLTDFLAGFCTAERRLVLDSACDPREVLSLSERVVRRRGGMPPLVWRFDPAAAPDRETLVAVLRSVRATKGIPPVLTIQTA